MGNLQLLQSLAKVSNFEEIRKQKGMSPSEFYAFPQEPPSASKLPFFDAPHAKNALARFSQTQGIPPDQKNKVLRKIINKAKKFGIQVSDSILKQAGMKVDNSLVGMYKMVEELLDPEVQKWISNKIGFLIREEKKPPEQAKAIAFSLARKKFGSKRVPSPKSSKK